MLWTLIFYLFLIGGVIHLCSKAFKYIPLSRFHHLYIPIYSLIMFMITFNWKNPEWTWLAGLFMLGIMIGWYQSTGVEIKKEIRHHHKRYLVKRNTPFVIGWIILLILGIGLGEYHSQTHFLSLFSDKIIEELVGELDPFLIFSEHHPWYIWCLSSVSSLTFLFFTYPKTKELEKRDGTRS